MKKGDTTRQQILAEGVKLAANGLDKVSGRAIGDRVGIAHTAVFYYFATIEILRDAVAAQAVADKDEAAIARLIVDNHSAVSRLSAAERMRYLTRYH